MNHHSREGTIVFHRDFFLVCLGETNEPLTLGESVLQNHMGIMKRRKIVPAVQHTACWLVWQSDPTLTPVMDENHTASTAGAVATTAETACCENPYRVNYWVC